jgi:thiamine-monophosphate kinase
MDDGALILTTPRLLISTDSVNEFIDFRFPYVTPFQVGEKACEGAASDIVAMGAYPEGVLVAISMPLKDRHSFFNEVMSGIESAAARFGGTIIGGDTSNAARDLSLVITVLGRQPKNNHRPLWRSGAKVGDLLFVSGKLGGSLAGFHALYDKRLAALYNSSTLERLVTRHVSPKCRNDLIPLLQEVASSAIDISDGLASESKHLAFASGVSIEIDEERLSVFDEIDAVSKWLGVTHHSMALQSGEEYEILFTAPPNFASLIADSNLDITLIGRVLEGEGVYVVQRGKRTPCLNFCFSHGELSNRDSRNANSLYCLKDE